MNIKQTLQKINSAVRPIENDIIFVIVIVAVALISFGLGRLSVVKENKAPVTVKSSATAFLGADSNLETSFPSAEKSLDYARDKQYVASKSGTKYHFPWCAGAQSIKEENKIWFATKTEAEKAGYTPASNCKGL